MVSSVNGKGIFQLNGYPIGFTYAGDSHSAYDCCVACQTTGGCYGYGSQATVGFPTGPCLIVALSNVAQGQCGSGATNPGFSTSYQPDAWVIGNGPCGEYQDQDYAFAGST